MIFQKNHAMTKHQPIQLDEIIFKHLIVHWYEEMQLNIECLHNRANGYGRVPDTLILHNVLDMLVVIEALVGKLQLSQWLLWYMASLLFLTDDLVFPLLST